MRFLGGSRYDAWRHRRLLQRARAYTVATLPENTFGKIVGRARPAAGRVLLEAPFSGRLCVYYDATVHLARGKIAVRKLGSEQQGIPFTIADDTGDAHVDPVDAYVSTSFDYVEYTSTIVLDDRQRDFLRRLKLSTVLPWDGDAIRCSEALIEVDERIAVFGGGVREPDRNATDGMYRNGSATRLCLTGTPQFPLFISDDPKAL